MILLPLVLGSALAAPGATPGPATAEPTPAASVSSLITAALQEEAADEPDGLWHGSINVGLSRSEGNANVENYSLDARGTREFDQHRYTIDALWFMARDNDGPSGESSFLQRRALGSIKYDQFFSEKTYFWVNALAETNLRASLDLRWTVGAGLGQQWRDDEHWKINTEAGLALFNEEFDNGDKFDYLAARLAWDIWAQVTETVTFGHFAEIFPSLDDKDDIYGRANTYLEALLSDNMSARLSWIANYDNTPTTDANGDSLDRLDSLYLLSVGWTF